MKTKSNLLKATALFALAIMYLGTATAARADVSDCNEIGDSEDVRMKRVTYLGPFNSTSTDLRANAEDPNNPASNNVELKGWLYYPSGNNVQNRPVVIYNHGHARERPEPCAVAKYFVRQGFVVFAPLRRGHNSKSNPTFRSTGVHIDYFTSKCLREARSSNQSEYPILPQLYTGSPFCREGAFPPASIRKNAFEVDYIRSQHEDVREQIRFIKEQLGITINVSKLADPNRIAVLGHSWGGSLSIFTNEYDYGQNVIIDVSGAELSWNNPEQPFWEWDLTDAMDSQKFPMYFLQPKNGLSLSPTRVLFGIAVNKEYSSQAAIFPKAPCDNDPCDITDKSEAKQAHENFIGTGDQVRIWGPTAVDFINRHPR